MVASTIESALEKSILASCKILDKIIVKHITILVAAREIKKLEFLKEFRYEKVKETNFDVESNLHNYFFHIMNNIFKVFRKSDDSMMTLLQYDIRLT